MRVQKPREFQIIRLFATLGILTLLLVLLFKVVLFAPPRSENLRVPAESAQISNGMLDIKILQN
jgi:hypothetical protein